MESFPWKSMEFYEIPWGIRTGIPWNSMEFHGNINNRLGSSMEIAPWSCCMEFNGRFSMVLEFHGLIKFHGVPLNTTAFLINFHGI